MEWLLGAALLPMLVCGVMCGGGVVLAAIGVRRGTSGRSGSCHSVAAESAVADRPV